MKNVIFKLNMCFGKFIKVEWVAKVGWSIHGYRSNQRSTLWTKAFIWTFTVGKKIQGLTCRQLWLPEQHILIEIDADAKHYLNCTFYLIRFTIHKWCCSKLNVHQIRAL